ncbi:hypothetical protein Moror_9920 [Moniliophthora roreri MCA 2997]|uniref:Uncharacterized protein n=1 Tax=Moniliophthora roreri (strain MCA 2997) TaxID=1381753 RepID=V2WYU0_MONRO|nr:hypothetical protein Moror_9920 [Moniliophthora roreri MCA 2997]
MVSARHLLYRLCFALLFPLSVYDLDVKMTTIDTEGAFCLIIFSLQQVKAIESGQGFVSTLFHVAVSDVYIFLISAIMRLQAGHHNTKRASIGHMFYRYVDGFLSCLKCYVENFDEDDITHFNEAVTQSKFQVHINPLEHKAPPTINCEIKDRVFNILFRQEKLGYSQG